MGEHLALPATCKSVVVRKGNYRGACEGGRFTDKNTPWRNEVHHILCQHAITDFDVPADKLEYIRACLCLAEWDINASNNLLGLPLKKAYKNSDYTSPVNLTCHNVDHNTRDGYTKEVRTWLHDEVWDGLVVNQKEHAVEAESIVGLLDDCIDHFKRQLKKRGERNNGTLWSYQHRLDAGEERQWYHPFSMAKVPTHRSPGMASLKIFAIIR